MEKGTRADKMAKRERKQKKFNEEMKFKIDRGKKLRRVNQVKIKTEETETKEETQFSNPYIHVT